MLHTDIPHGSSGDDVHLGTAGWSIRREHASRFAGEGTHLQRYATLFNSVEINSCFYRPHRFATYERWAAAVPGHFRFAVKLPKVITHESRLADVVPALERFLAEIAGLGTKLGPILVQLPPSFAFDDALASSFFTDLRTRFEGDVVFEPRHESWFTEPVDGMLIQHRIARVAADPARVPAAAEPGGYDKVVYLRLHGSPRIYYSAYTPETLEHVARVLEEKASSAISTWCIFDNTALGAATTDALTVKSRLLDSQRVSR
jgi:uncharacterized protein YecE (DUF72 family)